MGLVERDAVVAELRTALSDSAKGCGKVAVIRGGIASGKTALLRAFEEHAVASGATLLRASGAPSEQSLRFGVIEQFFSGATTPPEASAMLSRLTGLDAPQVGGELSSAAQSGTRDAHDLCVGLLELSRKGPLVITVDDHQFADSASLQVLTYLQHRIGTARVMLLLSQGTEPPSELVAEALRQPYSRQFTLHPLSPEGVGQLLAQRLDSSAALRQAPGSYALTGGNPLLTRALIDDSLAPAPEASAGAADGPVTGQAFTRAVVACLHRGGPQLLRTARAIAVLGEFAAPALLARFLDVRPSVVGGALEALELAGLTIDAQFRYEGTRAAVLDELTPEERSALNRRAAELLHHDGVAPSDVVGYLLAAGEADEPWAARVLHAAADQALPHAEQALALGKVAEAVQYLEFASRSCGDEHKRAMLTARLAWVQWTSSPAAATRHHGPLQTALEKELLSSREVMRLVRSLAWHGRPKEAVRALESLGAPPEGDGSRDQAERKLTRQWLSRWHPQIFAQVERHAAMSEPPGSPGPARRPQTAVLPRGTGNSPAVEGAEQVLQRARVRETPLASVISALHELLAAERFERAMYWCNELLQKAEGQHAAAWRGVLLDTRAAVSLRLGDLADAERDACSALTTLSARSWGVAIGSPLSHAVHAATMRGHFDKAAELLNQMIPQAMMDTRYGLQYRTARGHFHLATDRPHAALEDFEAVGDLVVKWKLDHPMTLPWRGDLAQALVRVGQTDRARELIKDQLRMIGPDSTRMRGVSLEILASVSDLKQRLPLLGEVVDLLQAGGDRYELARAFVELGQVWQILGKLDRAQLIRRRALQLAKSCHAEQLYNQLVATREPLNSETAPSQWEDAEGMAVLSEAERRVAALAALGRTNREIGRKLHITVSTVEQHLTRVYRKLNIKRRADLPVGLPADIADIA
ncbi:helix-turn-helix transcriptional regulator [Streptomyces lydicus]|uniref:Helix-turn-helix transcriptional regulator n=2 Tax=Streptomyces lydicus TaxID=47763 RepID=A0A3S9Y6U3_9ACTN|nr:AAA family ATPase [Streptomyces lydicus]AZS70424.1 helix-turn-helix transcriptional regulator [Streptomyces lydicus]